MKKKELLDYLESLINKLKKEVNEVNDTNLSSLVKLKDKIQSIIINPDNIVNINLEQLDQYINIPYDLLNYLTFYQQISSSNYYSLDTEQKKYIAYNFANLLTIIDKIIKEKKQLSYDISANSLIVKLNDIRNILISKININLDDFMLIVGIIKDIEVEYKNELLNNLSSYMYYALIDNKKVDYVSEKRSK